MLPTITTPLIQFLGAAALLSIQVNAFPSQGGIVGRQSTPVTGPPIPLGTDAILCTGLNLTGLCFVTPGRDSTCHNFTGRLASFNNATKSLFVPPGPELACALFRRLDCPVDDSETNGVVAFIGGTPGSDPPVNDLSTVRFADVAQSFQCAFIP
ncbi:hypothetical protein CPB84DRAFT_1794189 [Gymnopilus junonius]|uniref:Uncharacterized protein n=1 Tax=Gymnopilus junonius TaxID=109634 RepID=A0A9P5NE96_GYMJU|nr:hypothetical protein CPB84DRAFT_1794189 [Gymnopilus junonius]